MMKVTIIATGHFTAVDNGQILDLELKDKRFTVSANNDDSLSKLKEKIKAAEKIPTKQQVLNYENNVLKDDRKTMKGLGIKEKCEIYLNSTLDGDEDAVVDKDAVTDD